jgi:hypothetical protein
MKWANNTNRYFDKDKKKWPGLLYGYKGDLAV